MKAPIALKERHLTAAEFQGLAAVPPELEWFANLRNDQTRRAYRHDVGEFSAFIGLHRPTEIRLVTRAHVIAWRERLEHSSRRPPPRRSRASATAPSSQRCSITVFAARSSAASGCGTSRAARGWCISGCWASGRKSASSRSTPRRSASSRTTSRWPGTVRR